jgi:hypothetical protein
MVLTNVNKFVVIGFGMFVLNEAKTWQVMHESDRQHRAAATLPPIPLRTNDTGFSPGR